jgi:hypothetical protein
MLYQFKLAADFDAVAFSLAKPSWGFEPMLSVTNKLLKKGKEICVPFINRTPTQSIAFRFNFRKQN